MRRKIEVLDVLVLRALELALPVANLPLEVEPLLFAHDGGIALERLLLSAQPLLHRREIALARTELVLELFLRGLQIAATARRAERR